MSRPAERPYAYQHCDECGQDNKAHRRRSTGWVEIRCIDCENARRRGASFSTEEYASPALTNKYMREWNKVTRNYQ